MQIPGEKDRVIGELQTISYSTHREINPVRTLGRINPAGFVRGPRTIGGSFIFTVFDKSFVRRFATDIENKRKTDHSYADHKRILADEMPAFDITISFANEFGSTASIKIFKVIILNEGQVMSINDIMTESTMSFIAQEIEVMG